MTISQRVETVFSGRDESASATVKKIELGAIAADKASKALTNALKGAVAFFAAKFSVGFVSSILKAGTSLSSLSRGIGVSVEDLSRLRFAFETAGVGGDKLKEILETLEKKRAAALRGSQESANAFGVLGIDFEKLSSLNAAQLLDEIASGLGKFATQQQKAAALAPIFESNLGALTDILGRGKESFQSLTHEADTFGATIATKTANDLERADAGFRKFTATVDTLASSLGARVLSSLFGGVQGAASDIGSADRSIENLIKQMQELADRSDVVTNAFTLVGVAGLTFDEAMRTSTLSTEKLSLVLQELAKRLTNLIETQAKAKAVLEASAAGPQGPLFGPEARAMNSAAEGEAARNARFKPPTVEAQPGFVDGLNASWDRLVQTMGTATAAGQQFGDLVGASIGGVTDILVDMIATGKSSSEAWKKFGASILAELAKIALQYAIIGAIKAAFGLQTPAATQGLAHGGVMGGGGHDEPMRIHQFAHGGIARGRSVAVYGETSRAEAYVPLQDGRSLPVTITGSGGASVLNIYHINAMDSQSMAQALQRHGAIYRGAVRDGFAFDGGDRRTAKRAVR